MDLLLHESFAERPHDFNQAPSVNDKIALDKYKNSIKNISNRYQIELQFSRLSAFSMLHDSIELCSPSAQTAAFYCLEQATFDNDTDASSNTILTALKNFYVDDGLFSFPNEAEVIYFCTQIVPMLALCGFPLTKFFTTCEGLKKIIPKNDLLPVKKLKFKDEACLQNTLGMT